MLYSLFIEREVLFKIFSYLHFIDIMLKKDNNNQTAKVNNHDNQSPALTVEENLIFVMMNEQRGSLGDFIEYSNNDS